MKRAIVFDSDLDGLLSAIILSTTRYRNNSILIPSSPVDLTHTISKALSSYDELIFLDLGLNENDLNIVKRLNRFLKAGIDIIWIDTHPETITCLKKGHYKGTLCYKKKVATTSIVHQIYGTNGTKRLQKIASIMEKELRVNRDNKYLKEGNFLEGAIIGISNDNDFQELIDVIKVDLKKPFYDIKYIVDLRERGDRRADNARYWLHRNIPIKGRNNKGPAIWFSEDGSIFDKVSGKALRTMAFQRDAPCLLVFPLVKSESRLRFKVQVPENDKIDRKTPIIQLAKKINGDGGGYTTAFGGWINKEDRDEFINKSWETLVR